MSSPYSFEIGDDSIFSRKDVSFDSRHGGNQKFLLQAREKKEKQYFLDMVSSPFSFKTVKSGCDDECLMLATNLEGLVVGGFSPVKRQSELAHYEPDAIKNRSEIRVAMYSIGPLSQEQLNAPWDTLTTVPMTLQIISNIPHNSSRSDKEKGCLAKLVRLCGGPENITLELEGMGSNNNHQNSENFPWIDSPLRFCWNEEHLLWESQSQATVSFIKWKFRPLTSGDRVFCVTVLRQLRFGLSDAGVCRVLEKVYGNPGGDWQLQRNLLEEAPCADLMIVSEHAENPIPCHRSQLVCASQVFADMLKESNGWEETKGRVKLPESENALWALLHFIYYGGAQRIFGGGSDIAVELLQAGHKYDIQSLVDLAAFVLNMKCKMDTWWTMDAAWDLFCFARVLEGPDWAKLRDKAFSVLIEKRDQFRASEAFQKLVDIAEKLGPIYLVPLEHCKIPKCEQLYTPVSIEGVPKEDAELFFDYVCCYGYPASFGMALALMVLAEYCKRKHPFDVKEITNSMLVDNLKGLHEVSVDYLVDLFCAVRKREGPDWNTVKTGAVRKLKRFLVNRPVELEASSKYKEMFQTNYEAAMEYSRICIETSTEKI